MISSWRSAATNCPRRSISKYFDRPFATNVSENEPCKGDKGAFQLALRDLAEPSHRLVVVGMSGGVDSSAAAFLLAQQVKMLLSPYVLNYF